METPHSPQYHDSGWSSHPSPAERDRRTRNRRVFREMVKLEIVDRPLSWFRRRALIRFAERMKLDPFEARLIVRAVEYECGHVAMAAMDEVRTPVATEFLEQVENETVLSDWKVVIPAAIGILCFIQWLLM
ncbi:MAG: hypothetical protein ACE5EC_00955 [Phycisphaerae bacterium]